MKKLAINLLIKEDVIKDNLLVILIAKGDIPKSRLAFSVTTTPFTSNNKVILVCYLRF